MRFFKFNRKKPKGYKHSLSIYKQFLQYTIKKGKKETFEKTFRKSAISWIKNYTSKPFFTKIVNDAFLNTRPYLGVQTKRKGSKNIYIPIKLSLNRGNFLAAKWMLTNAILKKKRFFSDGILEELFESSVKKSSSVKKCVELHKLVEDNITNIKKKKI